jgi:hypothetical protein
LTALSGILAIGQGLRAESNKVSASIDKNFESQSSTLRKLFTSLGTARQKAKTQRMYGPNSKSYMTSEAIGSAVRTGQHARADLALRLREDLHSHMRSFNSKKEVQERLASAPDSGALFSSEGETMNSEQLGRTKEWAKTVLDPQPARNLPSNANHLSRDYNATRKAKESKLLIPEAVMSDLIAARAPIFQLENWTSRMYSHMGGQNSTQRTVDGKLSENELMSMIADSRFANQQWHTGKTGIHGKTKTGVLREFLQSRVDRLKMEMRELRWMDRMAALLAERVLSGNARFNRMLRRLQGGAE